MRKFFIIDFDKSRIYGLDILRAFAILFVVVGHGSYLLPKSVVKIYSRYVLDGVSIFFVLSGFLIGGILIKILEKEECSFKVLFNFWIRRWFRTLPNYFLILLILMIISFLYTDNFNLWNKKQYVFFMQNFQSPHPLFFSEAWSLSVEEWFYLLIPSIIFILIGIFRFSPKTAVIITAVSITILVTAVRFYRYSLLSVNSITQWDAIFRKQVITRLDCLMFGVIAAYICFYHNTFWIKHKKKFFIIGLTILALQQNLGILPIKLDKYFYLCVYSFTITSLGTLCLLPYLSEFRAGKGLIYRALTYVSLTSYSMYLLNYTLVQSWMLKCMGWFNLSEAPFMFLQYFLYWFFTITGSIILYKYFEIPCMKLRDRKYISVLSRVREKVLVKS